MLDSQISYLRRQSLKNPADGQIQYELAVVLEEAGIFKESYAAYINALRLGITESLSGIERVLYHIKFIAWDQDGAEMVFVPAGVFYMGSKEGPESDRPMHKVYLDAYLIDRWLVSNNIFTMFVRAGGYEKEELWSHEGWKIKSSEGWIHPRSSYWLTSNRNDETKSPVTGICWYEAEAFCNWAGKSLPTEAQWEKASRGGIWLDGDKIKKIRNTQPFRSYPWGDEKSAYESGSPYECQMMQGFLEWCLDWYKGHIYQRELRINPCGSFITPYKSLRGREDSRSTLSRRFKSPPSFYCYPLGFRTVVSLEALLLRR